MVGRRQLLSLGRVVTRVGGILMGDKVELTKFELGYAPVIATRDVLFDALGHVWKL